MRYLLGLFAVLGLIYGVTQLHRSSHGGDSEEVEIKKHLMNRASTTDVKIHHQKNNDQNGRAIWEEDSQEKRIRRAEKSPQKYSRLFFANETNEVLKKKIREQQMQIDEGELIERANRDDLDQQGRQRLGELMQFISAAKLELLNRDLDAWTEKVVKNEQRP